MSTAVRLLNHDAPDPYLPDSDRAPEPTGPPNQQVSQVPSKNPPKMTRLRFKFRQTDDKTAGQPHTLTAAPQKMSQISWWTAPLCMSGQLTL